MLSQLSLPGKAQFNLTGYLALVYSLFLAGFFLVPNAVDLYKFYSVAVFLPGLFAVKQVLKKPVDNKLWYSILAYLVYMLLSSFWSMDFSSKAFFNDLRLAAYILMFLLITGLVYAQDQRLFENTMRLICICAGLAALV